MGETSESCSIILTKCDRRTVTEGQGSSNTYYCHFILVLSAMQETATTSKKELITTPAMTGIEYD